MILDVRCNTHVVFCFETVLANGNVVDPWVNTREDIDARIVRGCLNSCPFVGALQVDRRFGDDGARRVCDPPRDGCTLRLPSAQARSQ